MTTYFRAAALLVLLVALAPSADATVNVQLNADGTAYTAVRVSGSSTDKYDIVFVGDGFRAADQAAFNARVDEAVAALDAMVPYSQKKCALNIWRVNVISADAGVDHPKDNIFKNTELDCRYGQPAANEAERCITSDSPAKCFEASAFAPDADAVFVLVNDAQWGGCAGSLVFSSIATGFAGIITHELGHKIGDLADEYTCYVCDGSDGNATYTGAEPGAANLTKATTLPAIKWNSLIAAGTPIPTVVDSPVGVVGLWEGGGYFPRGIFRPQTTCHMRETGSAFCGVCEGEMRTALASHCSLCENNPLFCLDLTHIYQCRPPCLFARWPIGPECPQCGDTRLDDEIRYVLEGQQLEGAQLEVLDGRGRVVARGESVPGGLSVSFRTPRTGKYTLQLTRKEASKEAIGIRASVFRNGVQQQLPRTASER